MGLKSDLMNAQTKALKAGDTAEAERLGKLIDRLKKLRGDKAAGIGPGERGLFGPSSFTVGEGESPLSIAQRVFGFADLSTVKLIAEFNPKLFQVDPATGDFVFTGKPGDVLDLSFAAAPGLLPADARFLNAPFGAGVAPGPGEPGYISPALTGVPQPGETGIPEGQGVPRPPFTPPSVATSDVTRDFRSREAAFEPGQTPYTTLPQAQATPGLTDAFVPGGSLTTPPPGAVAPPGVPAIPPEEAKGSRAKGAGFGVTPEGGAAAAPSTTAAADAAERGIPFMGGIMGGEDDPFTQASVAFTQSIYEASLNPEDPASRDLLPLIVPEEVAQFTAPQYASSANDFSVSATEFMTGLGYWQDDGGDWHRVDIAPATSTYRGNGELYRSGVSTRNRYFRIEKGRLKGPRVPGPAPSKPPPRGSTSRAFPGTVMWNVRFPELT